MPVKILQEHDWKTPWRNPWVVWCCRCGTLRYRTLVKRGFWHNEYGYSYVTPWNHHNLNFNTDVLKEEPECVTIAKLAAKSG